MANLARTGSQSREVQRLARKLQGTDWESYLRSVFRYREENEEIVRTPEFMVSDLETTGTIEGDCDDVAVLAASIAKAIGYDVRFTALQTTTLWEYDHVFAEIFDRGNWIPIDITVPGGTEYPSFAYMSEVI